MHAYKINMMDTPFTLQNSTFLTTPLHVLTMPGGRIQMPNRTKQVACAQRAGVFVPERHAARATACLPAAERCDPIIWTATRRPGRCTWRSARILSTRWLMCADTRG